MILRPATPADAPALAALGRAAFVAKFGHLYSPENLARFLSESHSPVAVAREIADPGMVVHVAEQDGAEQDGALVGMCKLKLVSTLKDEAAKQQERPPLRPLEIKQLYTAPDRTGLGIGTALMDWAMDFARSHGADEVQLSVWSENHDAQRFYARYGFVKTADIAFWVGDHRDDEFLFARRL